MFRRTLLLAPALAAVVLIAPAPGLAQPPSVKGNIDHPRLRAALHELREAREVINKAKDAWPPGHKEQALASIQAAIRSVRTILNVKDVENFTGVDRNPEYYKRFRDHPRLRAALEDVRDARDELRTAKADFGNLKEQALDDLDVASGSLVTLIRYNKK